MPLTTTKSNMAPGTARIPTNYGDLQKIAVETGLDTVTIQKVLDAFSSGGFEGPGGFFQTADALSTPGNGTAGATPAAAPLRHAPPKDFTAPGVNATSNGDAFSYTTKQGVRMNLTGAAAQAGKSRYAMNGGGNMPPAATPPPAPQPQKPAAFQGNAFAGAPDARRGMGATPPVPQGSAFAGAPDVRSGMMQPGGIRGKRVSPTVVDAGDLGVFGQSDKIAPGQQRQGIGPQTVPGFQDRVGTALAALSQGAGLPPGVEARYRDKLSGLLDQGEPTVGQLMQELSLTRAEAQRILQALKGGVI